MATANANANFYFLGGQSVHDHQNPVYQEYRRCWFEYPANFFLRNFPMHLDIEVTNRCNLRCTFCDKLPLLSKDQMGDMDIGLYCNILDQGSEGNLWGIKLSYRGEPLLHPQIVKMVAYAKQRGILDVYFNTNGMLLTPKLSQQLMDAGLDRVSISMEGTDPGAFERERIGAKFHRIVRHMESLISLREKGGYSHPRVRVQTIKFPSLDLEKYQRYWQPYCDEVAAVDYKDTRNRVKSLENPKWACPQLWQRMSIEWDGTIIPCNNDDFRLLSPGNVREKAITACWHDPRINHARGMHEKGLSHLVEACNGCPWRTAQILKLRQEE